ncbi:hypothetical protein Vi05172_g2902 [Venturia inaequalis]|nr:hypothetical protein Vi05172_g2902 [Venturia inaequalis]
MHSDLYARNRLELRIPNFKSHAQNQQSLESQPLL